MQWKDIGNIVGKAAPLLGSLLGGPAGGAVGTLIASTLGVEDDPQEVEKLLKTDPQALTKLKELEYKHKEKLKELKLQEETIRLKDVASARSRQIEHEKATGKTDINLYVLAWSVVLGFFALVFVLVFVSVPEDSTGVIYMLFGTLATAFGVVMQYFFGSSKGSTEKTKLLAGKN